MAASTVDVHLHLNSRKARATKIASVAGRMRLMALSPRTPGVPTQPRLSSVTDQVYSLGRTPNRLA